MSRKMVLTPIIIVVIFVGVYYAGCWLYANFDHFQLHVFPDMDHAYAEAHNSRLPGNHDFHLISMTNIDPQSIGWQSIGWTNHKWKKSYQGRVIEGADSCSVKLVFSKDHKSLSGFAGWSMEPQDSMQKFKVVPIQVDTMYLLTDALNPLDDACIFRITKSGEVRFGVRTYPFPN